MLARRQRLPRKGFSVPKGARKLSSEHFLVITVTSTGAQGGCAAVVPKKIARKAVDRHRLKRRMLAVMRDWCHSHRVLIVHARAGAASIPFRAITEELGGLLSRIVRADTVQ